MLNRMTISSINIILIAQIIIGPKTPDRFCFLPSQAGLQVYNAHHDSWTYTHKLALPGIQDGRRLFFTPANVPDIVVIFVGFMQLFAVHQHKHCLQGLSTARKSSKRSRTNQKRSMKINLHFMSQGHNLVFLQTTHDPFCKADTHHCPFTYLSEIVGKFAAEPSWSIEVW